jgi:hypothetical protein
MDWIEGGAKPAFKPAVESQPTSPSGHSPPRHEERIRGLHRKLVEAQGFGGSTRR